MSNLLLILWCIGTALPMLFICLLANRGNLPKNLRAYQLLVVPLALLYTLVVLGIVDQLLVPLQQLLVWLAGMALRLPMVGGWLSERLMGLTHNFWLIVTMNFLVAMVWLVVKRALRAPLASLAAGSKWLREALVENFYERPDPFADYTLKNDYRQTRRLLWAMWWAMVAIACGDMILCRLPATSATAAYAQYPILGVLLLGEAACFLTDSTASRKKKDEEEEEEDPADFDQLHRELEDAFGDRLLASGKIKGSPGAAVQDLQEELEEMCLSDDGMERIVGNYFLHRLRAGETVEKSHVQAALCLLRGQSVLLCDPFYRDLTGMFLLPIQHQLLNHRKVLVLSGRCAGDEDVLLWLRQGLLEATGLPELWKADFLPAAPSPHREELPDVGVLRFHDLYNLELQQANQAFFEDVALVILLEPSNLLGAGQVGLRSVCQQCEADGKKLIYCICDRNCDGMVDALSHAVRQSLVEVAASPVPRCDYHQMLWAVEGAGLSGRILPHVSHYLGFGSELGVFALKRKVKRAYWYSGSRFALQDMRWVAGQYTKGLCEYIGQPAEQAELDRRFAFRDGLWQAHRHQRAFVMVEDEFYNLFEMARAFAARADGEGFVNVLSTNYLLRDYMCANADLLQNDPKAIPTICPDFARTRRNFILRALMLMAAAPQEETVLRRELSLYGCTERDVYRALRSLIAAHTNLSPEIVQVFYRDEKEEETGEPVSRKYFEVSRQEFGRLYSEVLCPAFFVVENEKKGVNFIGARMMGQVCQTLLPGQFFTYNGCHYEVQSISAQEGVVVRRAADHLNGRPCYRQLRTYALEGLREEAGSRTLRDMVLRRVSVDLRVHTDGYFELPSADDLRRARRVDLQGMVEDRVYPNKDALLVEMPGVEPEVLFTLCALLNEMFVTLYPNEQGFLCAVPCGAQPADDLQRTLVPALTGAPEKTGVLVVEDCYMDLGLMVSVERNMQRILEMMADYLDWYLDPGRQRRAAVKLPAAPAPEAEAGPAPETPQEEPAAPAEEAAAPAGKGTDPTEETGTPEGENAAPALADAVPGQVVEGEDEELLRPDAVPLTEPLREYLAFGGDEDVDWLAPEKALDWLRRQDLLDSSLHRARCGDPDMEEYLRHLEEGQHVCDFCGAAMESGSYEILRDGRERCPACSASAVRRLRDARALYQESHELLEKTFGIKLRSPITIRVTNAKAIAKELGEEFKPGKGFDGRALGFARNKNGRYSIFLETGAPKEAMQSTILHELTHIWQYENWDREEIAARYGQDAVTTIYEGMAVWAEIQLMLCTGQTARAHRYEYQRLQCDDEYGNGLRLYEKKYPFVKGVSVSPASSPFGRVPPL